MEDTEWIREGGSHTKIESAGAEVTKSHPGQLAGKHSFILRILKNQYSNEYIVQFLYNTTMYKLMNYRNLP